MAQYTLYSEDTSLASDSPTADASVIADYDIRVTEAKGGGSNDESNFVFCGFDLSSIPAAKTVTSAKIRVYYSQLGDVEEHTTRIRRIRRAGVTHLANWNTYDGTNNWGTAGAKNTSTDVYTANQFSVVLPAGAANSSPIEITHPNLVAMIALARADDGVLRLVWESLAAGLGTENRSSSFWSNEPDSLVYRSHLVCITPSPLLNII